MGIVRGKSAVAGAAAAACIALAPLTAFAAEASDAAEATRGAEIQVTVVQPETPSVHEGNIVGTAVANGTPPDAPPRGALPETGDQSARYAVLGSAIACMTGGMAATAIRKRNEDREL